VTEGAQPIPSGGLTGRLFARRRVGFVALMVFAVGMATLSIAFLFQKDGRTPFGTTLGGDFPQFYIAGKILNSPDRARLYDFALQANIFKKILPREKGGLPFAYPPIVAEFAPVLARLPYAWAAAAWTAISAMLYALGLGMLYLVAGAIPRADRRIAVWLALAFEPFLIECLHGGQVSTVAFAAACAGIFLQSRGWDFCAGLCLGMLAYKPTLLIVIIPILILGKQHRALAGTATTIFTGALLSWMLTSLSVCRDFLGVMQTYSHAVSSGDGFRTWKYMDLGSFLRLMHQPDWMICAMPIALLLAVILLLGLAGRAAGGERQSSLWSAALTATLVCNLYVGIYDTVLIVPGLFLAAESQYRAGGKISPGFKWLLLAVFAAPWISQQTAQSIGIQLNTLVLGAVLVWQLARWTPIWKIKSIDLGSASGVPNLPR
jgi:alpha-1,2-mannosyltransferase